MRNWYVRRAAAMLALVLVAALGAGCSGISVDTDYDPQYDFGKLKTYAWHAELPGAIDSTRTLLGERVRRAVDDELKKKPFRETAAGTAADFHVAWRASIERKIEADPVAGMGYGYVRGPRFGAYGGTEIRVYEEGTLILDIVDPRTKQLIWRGTARAIIGRESTPEEREAKIREAVAAMLARFPPAKKA